MFKLGEGVVQDLLLTTEKRAYMVYQTYVELGDQLYVLETASADVHAELGKLPLEALQLLCRLSGK